MARPSSPTAFTLIELLVVIGVVALLVGILLPTLGAARARARKASCGSNLHQLGVATSLYLDEFDDRFWVYYWDIPAGRQWWFGLEPGGAASGIDRALDRSKSVLTPYLATDNDAFNCPAFPYDDGRFYRKFTRRTASYGFNLHLQNRYRREFAGRESEVFVFADGIHFDFNPGFNEGHYIQYMPNPAFRSGYAHFRHHDAAQFVAMDGHVEGQLQRGVPHANGQLFGGAQAGNLADDDGGNRIYGF